MIAHSGFAGWKQKIDRRVKLMVAQAGVANQEELNGNVITVEARDFFRPYPSRHNCHWSITGEPHSLIGGRDGQGDGEAAWEVKREGVR